ncbi:hypothetical protein CRENBAI_003454 [Crenichthys baileyi]|uniref:Uncharacterized protein n=1 Tax=Crenichthys baileyi TaxID=28760 RepID=A0AAV9RE56_9TELE
MGWVPESRLFLIPVLQFSPVGEISENVLEFILRLYVPQGNPALPLPHPLLCTGSQMAERRYTFFQLLTRKTHSAVVVVFLVRKDSHALKTITLLRICRKTVQ